MPLQIFYIRINGNKVTTTALTKRDALSYFTERGYNVGVPDITKAGKKPKRAKKKGAGKISRPEGNRKG